MKAREYATLMAEYNAWMNERIYSECEGLGAEARTRDLGLFFGGLEQTLHHLVWSDRIFANRLLATAHPVSPLGAAQAEDFASLSSLRNQLDQELLRWAREVEDGFFDAPHALKPKPGGTQQRMPRYVVAVQMFNHQTHHRGQVHAGLTQLGVDLGSTDIPWSPFVVERLTEAVG